MMFNYRKNPWLDISSHSYQLARRSSRSSAFFFRGAEAWNSDAASSPKVIAVKRIRWQTAPHPLTGEIFNQLTAALHPRASVRSSAGAKLGTSGSAHLLLQGCRSGVTSPCLHLHFITPAQFAPAPASKKNFHANCEYARNSQGHLSSRHALLIRQE